MQEQIIELIRSTSTQLPEDIIKALKEAKENGIAKEILDVVIDNAYLAKKEVKPICQDTGLPNFFVYYGKEYSQKEISESIINAVKEATKQNLLRPNAIDTLTGKNTGDGIGKGIPKIYFKEWDKDSIKIDLLLKGGGSENSSIQYKLPDENLKAGRDLDGMKKCVLDAVFKAQGLGCSPGVVGVCVGGDRSSGYDEAKRQLLRKLDDENENNDLDKLEKDIVKDANSLGIGPMGLGGKTTLLGAKIGTLARHPACYFVSVSYCCWACRRGSIIIK